MRYLVRDLEDIHRIHQKVASFLKEAEELPDRNGVVSYSALRVFNEGLKELNTFFELMYLKTKDGIYIQPLFLVLELGTGYTEERARSYFDDVIRRLHEDVIQQLPFVRYIQKQGA